MEEWREKAQQEEEDLSLAVALSLAEEETQRSEHGSFSNETSSRIESNRLGGPTKPGGSATSRPPNKGTWSFIKSLLRPAYNILHDDEHTCEGCGKCISFPGRRIEALERYWHPECFCCATCGHEISRMGVMQYMLNEQGKPIHMECFRCDVCNLPLPRSIGRIEWKTVPFWKQKFCPVHVHDGTPRCAACQRMQPVDETFAALNDGDRVLCLWCLGTVVVNTEQCQDLYMDVLRFYKERGMQLKQTPPLSLVDNYVLNDALRKGIAPGESRNDDGPLMHTRGLCVIRASQHVLQLPGFFGKDRIPIGKLTVSIDAILVLRGLPKLLTGCIIAHELMHGWLKLENFPTLQPHVEEGLCQLMSMLWLESEQLAPEGIESRLASFWGYQIRNDPSYIYGDGFRSALEAYQHMGGHLPELLSAIKQVQGFPFQS